jgi:hypothetical protein
VDGVIVASANALCTDARLDVPFQIGATTAGTYFYNGDIAEIQVYDRALNPAEITGVDETLGANYGISGATGAVVVWGNTASGLANVPAGLTNVIAVASDSEAAFNLGLQAGGAVTGWGNNSQGQLTLPSTLTNVSVIAAGSSFGLAIGNEAPIVTNMTVSGYANHDLPIALSGVSPDGNPLSFYIQSLPPNGALYQFSAGVRGAQIQSPDTLVTDPGGQVIFAPAPGQTGTLYTTLSFIANDGFYSSGSALVTIDIALPIVPQFTGYSWNPGNSGVESFNLNFTGDSNATYSVWASTNLVNWVDLGTASESQPGQYGFMDTTVTNWPQQFYRISAP